VVERGAGREPQRVPASDKAGTGTAAEQDEPHDEPHGDTHWKEQDKNMGRHKPPQAVRTATLAVPDVQADICLPE